MKTKLTQAQTAVLNWLNTLITFIKELFNKTKVFVVQPFSAESTFFADTCYMVGIFSLCLIQVLMYAILGIAAFGFILWAACFVAVVINTASPTWLAIIGSILVFIAIYQTWIICNKTEVIEDEVIPLVC